jgi:MoaA/NifB/PqqE/SkfB family radical SAM enzyme
VDWAGLIRVETKQLSQVTQPLGLLAELTHRCPLGCPYCSNPIALDRREHELDSATWARVFREAAELGVLQVHLSGGEPRRGAMSLRSPRQRMRQANIQI